ncbi:MAG: RusA family crossover junction endodeoxyribonuclease [Dialister micraerophilus]|uniref:RusA family crossover junction endodeoxyribonuclease n=1 Tax=Dialister micraerophilus TaxID=309120 RepID=UPI00254A290B|nr:RusA family crossover junction endodeoxyribonuclease [Dialister micraerophilus]MDK8253227.1 RusA family crossover junction endodeoxyribonuclease [Dialister micraerophilus]
MSDKNVSFFIPMKIPSKTFQAKKITTKNGKAILYKSKELQDIETNFISRLSKYKPEEPLIGAIGLSLSWIYEKDHIHKGQYYKTTKPDLDNLGKLFKDCMTICGFWRDDSQIVQTTEQKIYGDFEGVYVSYMRLESNQ